MAERKVGTLATFTGTGAGATTLLMDGDNLTVVYGTTGTGTNTIQLEVSVDGGTTFGLVPNSSLTVASTTIKAFIVQGIAGLVRAYCTAHNSGTHTVKYQRAGSA